MNKYGIMTKKDLLEILSKVSDDTEIYVRHGASYDDAYPAKVRYFDVSGGNSHVLYFQIDDNNCNNHLNFPEGYSGVTEVKLF